MNNRPASPEIHQRSDGTFGLYITGNLTNGLGTKVRVRLQSVNGAVIDRQVTIDPLTHEAFNTLVRSMITNSVLREDGP